MLDGNRCQGRDLFEDIQVLRSRAAGLTKVRSEEHTSELQSPCNLVCRLLLEKKKEDDIGTLPLPKATLNYVALTTRSFPHPIQSSASPDCFPSPPIPTAEAPSKVSLSDTHQI